MSKETTPQYEILAPPSKPPRIFEIDFDKVTDLRDVIEVLKGLNVRIYCHQDTCPEEFKSLHEQGYLKEV